MTTNDRQHLPRYARIRQGMCASDMRHRPMSCTFVQGVQVHMGHVHVSLVSSLNVLQIQQRFACTDVACSYVSSDAGQRYTPLSKACTHQPLYVHIDWETWVMVLEHHPCDIWYCLHVLINRHRPTAGNKDKHLHALVVASVHWLAISFVSCTHRLCDISIG